MALNNLRVVYNNLADLPTTTITASSSQAATPVGNLKKDQKGLVWRSALSGSTSNVTAVLQVDLGTAQTVHSVVLPFTNLNSSTATIEVSGYSAPATYSIIEATGAVTFSGGTAVTNYTQSGTCSPWNSLELSTWGTSPPGANTYAYGGGTCARLWFNSTLRALQARYLYIIIKDNYTAAATGRYIEASRLIIGKYWSPKYNTGYGMQSTIQDLSTHERTESGDLTTQRGPRFSKLNFDLTWLEQIDRRELSRILLGNGLPKPLFVSLFPDNGTTVVQAEMERAHQIYGKLMQVPGISYSMLDTYSTQLELEEV